MRTRIATKQHFKHVSIAGQGSSNNNKPSNNNNNNQNKQHLRSFSIINDKLID